MAHYLRAQRRRARPRAAMSWWVGRHSPTRWRAGFRPRTAATA